MIKHPDVLGFELTEAILILDNNNIEYSIYESIGKEKLEKGIKRVIGQKSLSDNEIELIISYF